MANQSESEKYSTATATKLFPMGNVATRFYNDVAVAASRAFPMGYSSLDLLAALGIERVGRPPWIMRNST